MFSTGQRGPQLLVCERDIDRIVELRQRCEAQRADATTIEFDGHFRCARWHVGPADDASAVGVEEDKPRHQARRTVRRWARSVSRPTQLVRWCARDSGRQWMVVGRRWHRIAIVLEGVPFCAPASIIDQIVQKVGTIAQKVPAALFGVRVGDAHAGRLQALERDVVEIAEKAAAKTLLLPDRKPRQREHAERRESDEESLPESKMHARSS